VREFKKALWLLAAVRLFACSDSMTTLATGVPVARIERSEIPDSP
jgi:hypothetical protein